MGQEEFETFYQRVFGDEWTDLKKSILRDGAKVKLPSHPLFAEDAGEYLMDPASILVAKSLQVQPGHKVLDLCAAPGGKSMILIQGMNGMGEIILNDASKDRMFRLRRVLSERLRPLSREFLNVISQDGRNFGMKNKDRFDRILLDAPCSGERHLLENETELAGWTESRSKNLAAKQYALLCSAMLALRPGGRLVYSTCALSPYENDEVIGRFLKRKPGEASVVTGDVIEDLRSLAVSIRGAATMFGWQMRPDRDEGWGPMYLSVLVKL